MIDRPWPLTLSLYNHSNCQQDRGVKQSCAGGVHGQRRNRKGSTECKIKGQKRKRTGSQPFVQHKRRRNLTHVIQPSETQGPTLGTISGGGGIGLPFQNRSSRFPAPQGSVGSPLHAMLQSLRDALVPPGVMTLPQTVVCRKEQRNVKVNIRNCKGRQRERHVQH